MTPVVRILLAANVAAFMLQMAFPLVEYFGVFVPQLIVIRPWTVITYMFLHGGLTHIAFNMLALFFFGPRVEDRMGSRRFMVMYFLSGITGALLSLVLSPGAALVGASAGVFGVMLCFAHYWPHEPIHIWGIIPVPARLLVILTTVVAIWSGFIGGGRRGGGGDNIAHFAHLGGYAGAYLYIRWLERGRRQWRQKVTAVPPTAAKKIEDWHRIDLASIHAVNRDEVKRLLDKIAEDGIGALTPQERLFLSNFVPLGGQASAPPS